MQDQSLTREEQIVLQGLADGLDDTQIQGFLLDPKDQPVKSYVQAMLVRLGLSSRAELLRYAQSCGLTPPTGPATA
jgi:DNA-binding NarL/FixJ family response regulator